MGSHFRSYRHQEFILFSILPVLAAALARKRGALDGWRPRLAVDRPPAAGRLARHGPLLLGDGHRARALKRPDSVKGPVRLDLQDWPCRWRQQQSRGTDR